MEKRTINIARLLNPTFKGAFVSGKPYKLFKGGRSGTKSSAISIKLVIDFLSDFDMNVVCLRKVASTLRTSVYEQVKWAIIELGQYSQFDFYTSPMKIVHRATGTAFYFFGVDDAQKLKGQKIAVGYVGRVWLEELAEFSDKEEYDTIVDTYIRQKLDGGRSVEVYASWNPPKNPYDWINEWVTEREEDPDYYIHHSTYKDDVRGFNSDQMLRKISRYKEHDLDYYRWMYLGEVVGLGTNVYNMKHFQPLNELFKDDPITNRCYALDGGHAQSATACGHFGITQSGKVILLNTLYYSPAGKVNKLAPSQLSQMVYNFIKTTGEAYEKVPILRRTIDSAEAALRNQYHRDFNIRWSPVKKTNKINLIDNVQSLICEGRFYYMDIPENAIFIDEHKRYQWDEKTIRTSKPEVVKVDDHTCDLFQYFCMDNAKLLRLKA
ncbi:MAG: PBSX family phage terminase large subunit [Streptococcaceae bacterium]|nr:PBSX family phage terminase large subunit [Streptococcaceae bacterium]MCL2680883.1 PBSX family phage terminase large subunit [Streptococcaceae bacterium]MCL2858079.1 PBSX family phage terminase large subunit [Streptococcaceae bacterium]